MAWTFDAALTTPTDRVRVLIGDTNPDDPLLTDEAVAMYLPGGALACANERLAAAELAGALAARFAGRALSISEGGASVNWGDVAARYRQLAADLRAAAADVQGGALFDVAEWGLGPFGERDVLANAALRGLP